METIYENEFTDFVFSELEKYYEKTTHGKEIAFESELGEGFVLRILSTIRADNGVSRSKGRDSIKVHIYKEGEIIESTSHVKRTKNYKENIKERLNELVGCPECGSRESRIVRNGEYGNFYYCTECEETESWES